MNINRIIFDQRVKNYKFERKHYNDAGIDIYLLEDVVIAPFAPIHIPTGFGVEIPDGYFGQVLARSSMAMKGIQLNGVIDSSYRGVIHLNGSNTSNTEFTFKAGERIGQLVICPCSLCSFEDILPENATVTERGTGGHGSTGK